MSYDPKPERMRVVSTGPVAVPQRRRGDLPAASADAPTPIAVPATTGGGRTKMLVVLFLIGCIAGGVALPLLGLA